MLPAPIILLALANAAVAEVPVGTALRTIYAQQIIDPEPRSSAGGYEPGSDGWLADGAVIRYHTDKVKKPLTIRSTQTISGSGGSSR
jgi:hypothetical protein